DDGDAAVHADPHRTYGRPGSRATHVWLERAGRQVSTLDLFGDAFVLLAAPRGDAWCQAASAVARRFPGLAIATHVVGGNDIQDPEAAFAQAYGLSDDGALLVRPDGFVAWRAKSMVGDPEKALGRALDAVLMKV
ncbi:MAG: monooxygenase, partial [Xanthobacteraceae bacterium]